MNSTIVNLQREVKILKGELHKRRVENQSLRLTCSARTIQGLPVVQPVIATTVNASHA